MDTFAHENPLMREHIKMNTKPLPKMWLLTPRILGNNETYVVIDGINNPDGEVIPQMVLDAMQHITDCEYGGSQWYVILLQLMIRYNELNYVDFTKVKN